MRQRYRVVNQFFPAARGLRREFELRFASPEKATPERFVWDFWHLSERYRHLRAAPETVFSKVSLDRFCSHLKAWGRKNLGCFELSPLWLSAYTDGCFQRLHADVPHGSWAFVFSLTPSGLALNGGRTLIAKDALVNMWPHLGEGKSFHEQDFFDVVEPKFNRLTVFDARLPHSVEEVRGSKDVLDARLVLHGWFQDPRPTVTGALSPQSFGRFVQASLEQSADLLEQAEGLEGLICFEVNISSRGKVTHVRVLSSTLVDCEVPDRNLVFWTATLKRRLATVTVSPQKGSSVGLVPLLFRRNPAYL